MVQRNYHFVYALLAFSAMAGCRDKETPSAPPSSLEKVVTSHAQASREPPIESEEAPKEAAAASDATLPLEQKVEAEPKVELVEVERGVYKFITGNAPTIAEFRDLDGMGYQSANYGRMAYLTVKARDQEGIRGINIYDGEKRVASFDAKGAKEVDTVIAVSLGENEKREKSDSRIMKQYRAEVIDTDGNTMFYKYFEDVSFTGEWEERPPYLSVNITNEGAIRIWASDCGDNRGIDKIILLENGSPVKEFKASGIEFREKYQIERKGKAGIVQYTVAAIDIAGSRTEETFKIDFGN